MSQPEARLDSGDGQVNLPVGRNGPYGLAINKILNHQSITPVE